MLQLQDATEYITDLTEVYRSHVAVAFHSPADRCSDVYFVDF
jgi:hypothetical protein